MRPRPEWLTLERFAGCTTGLTLLLVTLGIYTAATGAGLACSAQWPLCDGGVLPQTIPSFIEWFHRLVAMVTGGFIVGTGVWAWRSGLSRRGKLFATVAVVLLPLQVSIGAVTVTLNGALPGGYSAPTQGAHFVTALTIFSALVMTTLSAYAATGSYRRPVERRSQLALGVAIGALLGAAALSRPSPLGYGPGVQAAFYGVSLVGVAALLAARAWLGRQGATRGRQLATAALGSLAVVMLLGRDLVYYTSTVATVDAVTVLTAVGLGVLAYVTNRRPDVTVPDRGTSSSD